MAPAEGILLGSIEYLIPLSDFCALTNGLLFDFRLETEKSPPSLTRPSRDRTVTRNTTSERCIKYPTHPKFCRDSPPQSRVIRCGVTKCTSLCRRPFCKYYKAKICYTADYVSNTYKYFEKSPNITNRAFHDKPNTCSNR